MAGKRPIRKLALLLLIFALLLAQSFPASALDDNEFGGYAADSLTIKVGYFGGPYYEKAVFTLDQLWSMNLVYADYTFIDNMPSVIIDHVVGVRLSDLMAAAGIDLGSIQTFYFWTNDKSGGYYTSYSKYALIDVPRYCYYSLPDNFDEEAGMGNEFAALDAAYVYTVIALADDWNRCIAGATFGSDYMNLNTNTRFRLVFGQTNTYEHTANYSAKWIHEIVVELGGAPTLTLDASALEGEVGSVLRTEASVVADSAVLANEKIIWTSSDESIATVDENGNITIHAEGEVIITATFAGVSASVTVNGGKPGGEESLPDGGDAPGVEGEDMPTQSPPPEDTPVESPQPEQPSETPAPETSPEPVTTPAPTPSATPEPVTTPKPEPSPKPETTPEPVQPVQPEDEPQTEQTESMAPVFISVEVVSPNSGGVQNWRDTQMSETAHELPNIEVETPLLGVMGYSSLGLLLGSGALYAILFYRNIRRK